MQLLSKQNENTVQRRCQAQVEFNFTRLACAGSHMRATAPAIACIRDSLFTPRPDRLWIVGS